jgi:N-glycosidase YbiA
MTILFYDPKEPYGGFSNFSRHGFMLDGAWWPTSEHYFQAQKFPGMYYAEEIRLAAGPFQAAGLGRRQDRPPRPDWESVKEDVMRRALRAKFHAHPDLRELLLSTGEEALVENSPKDAYWGIGADGSGRNRLGHLLMEIRAELRAERPNGHPSGYHSGRSPELARPSGRLSAGLSESEP